MSRKPTSTQATQYQRAVLEAADRVNASLLELIGLAEDGRVAEARTHAVSLSRLIGAFLGPAAELLPPFRPPGQAPRSKPNRERQADEWPGQVMTEMMRKDHTAIDNLHVRLEATRRAKAADTPHTGLLSRGQILALVPLSDRTILDMEKRGDFPRRIVLSARRVGWNAEEIHAWIQARQKAADTALRPMAVRRKGKP